MSPKMLLVFPHLLIEVHGLSSPSIHLNASPEPLAKKRGKGFTEPLVKTE